MENESNRKEKLGKLLKWDCGSSLYDSVELESFERKLHSAINSRTLSMPHLSDSRLRPPLAPPQRLYPTHTQTHTHTLSYDHKSQSKKLSYKIPRSMFHKFVSFFHKPAKQQKHYCGPLFLVPVEEPDLVRKYGYDSLNSDSVGLSAIAEAPEIDNISPKIGSRVVRRTTSERFRADSTSISSV